MANASLTTYLNNHLAGSVAALELLSLLESWRPDDAGALAELRADVHDDRDELEKLVKRLGIAQSRPAQAIAWIAAKMGELKFRIDDSSGGAMRSFEGIETVAIGIDGKQALWRSLQAAADLVPELAGIDYVRLISRAVEQRDRIEVLRVKAARSAFSE